MARTGRPPKPTEIKRATGNPGQRKLPSLASIIVLPMADDIPQPPAGLEDAGLTLWRRAWSSAITWLSQDSDFSAIENACRIADALALAEGKYRATLDSADGRLLVALHKSMAESLSSLRFDPVSRSRLGVAEVKRVSALDELIAKRQGR